MSLFLSSLPYWVTIIFLIVLPTMAAMYGPVLIRRRIAFNRLAPTTRLQASISGSSASSMLCCSHSPSSSSGKDLATRKRRLSKRPGLQLRSIA